MKKELNFTLVVVILAITAVIVVGFTGYYTYKLSEEAEESGKEIVTREPRIEKEKPEEETLEEIVPKEIVVSEGHIDLTEDKILFTEKENIFMMDEFGEKTQVTKNAAGKCLQIIDDERLGYYQCDALVGDYNCGVYRVNVSTKQIEKLVREEKDKLITHLIWYDKDIFIYTVRVDFVEQELLYLYDNGSKSQIGEIKGNPKTAGRQIAFSPNGTETLLEAVTFSPRVLDFYGNELVEIRNATELNWIDEKTIIFRRPEEGLCSFDISFEKEKCYETDKLAYNPKVLRDFQKVVYWVDKDNGQVWLMDLTTGENEKLLDNASHPLWISQEEILVSKNQKCVGEDWECRLSFSTKSLAILNVSTKKAFDIEEIDKGWHCFTTSQSEEGYDYYLR